MATALSSLKLTTAKRSTIISPTNIRRNKLVKRLNEQIALAKAKFEGVEYLPTKLVKVLNEETGESKAVSVPKRVKEWWFNCDGNKIAISVRYGGTVVELAKGKTAVEIASSKELVPTLELLVVATQNGELDTQLEAASSTVKSGFRK